MRFVILLLCLMLAVRVHGAVVPMTPKDLALLVRMQVPEADILAELEKRRLSAPLTVEGEAVLKASGVSAELLEKIKKGNYSVSAAQAAVLAQAAAAREAAAQAAAEKAAAAKAAGDKAAEEKAAAAAAKAKKPKGK